MIGRAAYIKYLHSEIEHEPLVEKVNLVLDQMLLLVREKRKEVKTSNESESESDSDY